MNFADWIKNNWNIAGGLITQVTAAKILGKTKTRIRQMINENKLTEYIFENSTYVSYAEVMKILSDQQIVEYENIQTEQDANDYAEHMQKQAEEYHEWLQSLSPEERAQQEAKDKLKSAREAIRKAEQEAEEAEEDLSLLSH